MLESQTVEYKREYNQKARNTMLAFLNTDGGRLYIGIDDAADVCGIDGSIDLEARKIASSFRDAVTPDPSGYFKVNPETRNGKHIIVVEVERGSGIPYCYASNGLVPNGVYVRVGSHTVTASHEHIRQMIRDNSSGPFTNELSIEQSLSFTSAERVFAEKGIKFETEQKQSLGLIRPDGRYTNLALLLSDQCPYTTKAAIFQGTSREYFKDRKEFSGSLLQQIEDVHAYLHVFNRIRSTIEGLYRIDHPDYPEVAIREAFINALIHRDYSIDGSVLVSMYDDRLEFMSLGGVMPGVTYQMMLAGVSVSRNEKLAQIFYRLQIIEAFGTGIPRIFGAYGNCAMQPDIPIINGGFLLRLPNRNSEREERGDMIGYMTTDKAIDHVTDKPVEKTKAMSVYDLEKTGREQTISSRLTHEQRLLSTFPNSGFKKDEAADVLGLSVSGTYKLLQRMTDQGLLNMRKEGKQWVYSHTAGKENTLQHSARLDGKTVAFSGVFNGGSLHLKDLVFMAGGAPTDMITEETDFLIIGRGGKATPIYKDALPAITTGRIIVLSETDLADICAGILPVPPLQQRHPTDYAASSEASHVCEDAGSKYAFEATRIAFIRRFGIPQSDGTRLHKP